MISYVIIGSIAAYCVLDFILSMVLDRCVLPGLRCEACRRRRQAEQRRLTEEVLDLDEEEH